jgi:fermentation-respiration switch protein FrsA (DUF1100 family)
VFRAPGLGFDPEGGVEQGFQPKKHPSLSNAGGKGCKLVIRGVVWQSPAMAALKRKRILRILFIALLFTSGGCMFFRQFETSQVYHPSRKIHGEASSLGRAFEEALFEAEDGVKLHGWFFPADAASPRKDWAILQCHGNAGNISGRLGQYEALLETGASVFAFDYRGYGNSEGKPGEEGTYRDAQAAHRWLADRGFAATNIIVLGESLGGGVGSELALREPIKALILERTFTSIPDVGAEIFWFLPVRLLSSIKYDTLSKLPRITAPVLVLHSRGDEIVGFHHGEKNFEAANEPKLFRELDGGHNETLFANRRGYLDALEEFLKTLE